MTTDPTKTPMDLRSAITARRSIRQFTNRVISPDEILAMLQAGTQAPNHRMTQPWRFYVLGPEARRTYGEVLGKRKAKKVEDPAAAEATVERVAKEHADLPAMLAVAMTLDANPEIREEDYAATMMAIQNIALSATAQGLGVHIKTGAVMDDPIARNAVGVPPEERIVATLHVGEPAEIPPARARRDVAEVTRWVP